MTTRACSRVFQWLRLRHSLTPPTKRAGKYSIPRAGKYSILRSSCLRLSVEIEGVPNRRCQQFLLIGKKEPDLAAQCRNWDRDNVVDADDGILLEPVTHTDWNFGRQAANCSGDRRDGDSG